MYTSPLLARKVKKLKKQEKTVLDDAVLDIVGGPSIGEEKVGDLAGVRVYKFKINKQLILLSYTYDEIEINLLTFGSHENFYRDLKNYKKA
ncbi:MAG TPA: addiction module toxin RelE [Opitutae bacterium]|nr:addiction module toxin RelE [Opitutae bacterium]